MKLWVEYLMFSFLLAFEAGLWVLLKPGTFTERCVAFAICTIVLVLIICFVHLWRTKWKDRN